MNEDRTVQDAAGDLYAGGDTVCACFHDRWACVSGHSESLFVTIICDILIAAGVIACFLLAYIYIIYTHVVTLSFLL